VCPSSLPTIGKDSFTVYCKECRKATATLDSVNRRIESHLLQKHIQSKGPSPHRRYPASSVHLPPPTPEQAIVLMTTLEARPPPVPDLPQLLRLPSLRASLNTPVDWIRCSCWFLPRSMQPSPSHRRVGIHDYTFEACSSFTRVAACRVARPPSVGFVTRLHRSRSPSSNAR